MHDLLELSAFMGRIFFLFVEDSWNLKDIFICREQIGRMNVRFK